MINRKTNGNNSVELKEMEKIFQENGVGVEINLSVDVACGGCASTKFDL